jgi:CheY-like chemotaxis protein
MLTELFQIDQIPLWIVNNFVIIDAPFRVPMSVRILVAEDSALVRYSVRSLLQRCPDFHVVGEACDGFQAIDQSTTLQPDVVLLDVSMPNLSGLGAAPRIHEVSPESKILMFSQGGSANVVTAAMNGGRTGLCDEIRCWPGFGEWVMGDKSGEALLQFWSNDSKFRMSLRRPSKTVFRSGYLVAFFSQ